MTSRLPDGFETHYLDADHPFYTGPLPGHLVLDTEKFQELWGQHPEEFNLVPTPGGPKRCPRWQQGFGADYRYPGSGPGPLPVAPLLEPLLAWARAAVDERLNGILINWYDGRLRHNIGSHNDKTGQLVHGAPIVTLSFGEQRVFRLRPEKGRGYRDFHADDGTVFVMPYETNKAWLHEVPHFARYQGRRISATIRAFVAGVLAHPEGTASADGTKG